MVTVAWDGRRGVYVVTNRADRSVRVQFRSRLSITELLVPAHGKAILDADSVEHPFRATYVRQDVNRTGG